MNKVYVYGSLRKGMGNHSMLDGAEYIGECQLDGFVMISLGAFPGVFSGNGTITVEEYRVNDDTLAGLDCLEGYCPEEPGAGFYNRDIIRGVYMYTFSHLPDSERKQMYDDTVVEGGDWVAYARSH